jgi:hypothetical protein
VGEVSQGVDYWIRIGAVTGILAIALQEISDFSLQMPGNAVFFVVLLGMSADDLVDSGQAQDARPPVHGHGPGCVSFQSHVSFS